LILVFVLFVGGILAVVFGAMKQTDVYKDALKRAQNDTRVRTVLGAHIKDGMFPMGKTKVEGGSGDADLSISISGSKGKGTIYVEAKKSAGSWHYTKLLVKTSDGEEINLISHAGSKEETAPEDSTDTDTDDDST
jgi:hypothetical protein